MTPVRAPQTVDEYNERYERNHRETRDGDDTVQHLPCPFCAAPGWHETSDTGQSTTPIYCVACGRSAQFIRTERGRSNVPEIELVQVGGPDPPAFLDPPPRRIEQRDAIDPLAHTARGEGRLADPPVETGQPRVRDPRRRRRY